MSSLNILVMQRLSQAQLEALQSLDDNVTATVCKPHEAAPYLETTDILIAWGSQNLDEILPRAPRLKWVHALSAGVDGILSPAFIDADVILTNSRGIHGIPMAEHVLAMLLSFTRGITASYEQQKRRVWNTLPLEEVYEKSIAIIGLGSIGREIAKRAKCLGMKVLAVKRTITTELFVDKLYPAEQLPEALAAADFIVVTLPLTPQTRELFTLDAFRLMKRSAYFINVARGAIVREADLITALETGVIRGAALDVFQQEPLPPDSPLWSAPNLLLTPHIAARSPYYLDRSLKLFQENFGKLQSNAEMLNRIDKKKGY